MKINSLLSKSHFLLFFLFVFFAPLLSSASTTIVGSPCTPDIIPAFQAGASSTICSYCPTLSLDPEKSSLHLKWDIQGTFKDPVCSLQCWGPTGNACSGFSLSKILDVNGQDRSTNLKPKDDIYLTNPPMAGSISGPGTNMQIWCSERATPSLIKKSAGIRVVSGCEGVGGEPCEVGFTSIMNKLDDFQPFIVTEDDFSGWSLENLQDNSDNNGNGDREDLRNTILAKQCTGLSSFKSDIATSSSANLVRSYLINATTNKNAIPLGMGIISSSTQQFTGFHMAISLGVVSHNLGYSEFVLKVLDPQTGPVGIAGYRDINCKRINLQVVLGVDSLGLVFTPTPGIYHPYYFCDYEPSNPEATIALLLNPTSFPQWDYMSKLIGSGVRKETSIYLSSSKNFPNISNFLGEPGTPAERGICSGWTDFVLKTAYLGDFVGTDYHPDDGKYVGKDCDANHYPLPPKKTTLANSWLASLSQAFSNFLPF